MSTFQSSSASNMLWAHLRRKDAPAAHNNAPGASVGTLAPLAPIDKTGTSMRILLSDTQANFEKFGERVVRLTDGMENTKIKMDRIETMWAEEREKLGGEIFDLVKRCQASLQSCMDEQAKGLENLRRENVSLAKRLDDLQLLYQTQSQAIQTQNQAIQTLTQTVQTQSQALQTIQDQQNTMLTAIMPLSPLLQAVPLQIENAVTKAMLAFQNTRRPRPASDSALHNSHSPAVSARNRSSMSGQVPTSSASTSFPEPQPSGNTSTSTTLVALPSSPFIDKRARSPTPISLDGSSSSVSAPVMFKRRKTSTTAWTITDAQSASPPPVVQESSPAPTPAHWKPVQVQTKPIRLVSARTLRSPLSNITLTGNNGLVDPRHSSPDRSSELIYYTSAERSTAHQTRLPTGSGPDGAAFLPRGEVVSDANQSDRRIKAPPAVPLVLTAPTRIVNEAEFWKEGKRFIPLYDDSSDDGEME